jgi:light-regulated signal transduction histidine kinase (bacteriophytochrome)
MGDEIYCKTEAYVRRVLTGETLAFERAMTKVDGSVGHMLLQYAPDIGPDQEVRGFVVNALDITTINRTQLQLVRANTELEQFATFVSHDLRQPLSAVRGFLSLMKKIYGPQLPAEAGTLLQNAIASTSTMEEFIADVLEYSRLSNDSEPVLVSLADAVSEALTNLHQKIVDADVDLSVADKLPTIMGDPGALVRLFENLVGNAIKYRSHNRMLILEIGWRRQGDDEVVWVKDNGVGIAPVNHDIAFAMFKRLVPQDAVEGSGVGLAICKKVMERHGGKIWIESEIDQGTTMFMSFPVVPVAAAVAH